MQTLYSLLKPIFTISQIRDKIDDDYFKMPERPKPEELKNRISKQYQIAGASSRVKRQTKNPREDIIPENETETPSPNNRPFPYRFWRHPPKNMSIFYKNNIRAVAILV
jgi:hypothetical protein